MQYLRADNVSRSLLRDSMGIERPYWFALGVQKESQMKTVVGLIDHEGTLEQMLAGLQDAGFADESVTVVRHSDAHRPEYPACAPSIQADDMAVVIRTADEHAQRAKVVLISAGAEDVQLCADAQAEPQVADTQPARDRLSNVLCWSARLLGMVLIGVVLSFFIGEGLLGGDMPDLSTMSIAEDLLLLALLLTLTGLVVAWRWEGIGGLIIVGGVLLFEGIDVIASGSWSVSPLNPLFLTVAAIFLWDWWRSVDRTGKSDPTVSGGVH